MDQRKITCLLLLLLLWAAPLFAEGRSSANYVIVSDGVSNGSGNASSSSFGLIGVSQETGAGVGTSGLYTNKSGNGQDLLLAPGAHSGDLNRDGTVDIIDALYSLRIAVGIVTPRTADITRGDVAPIINGVAQPDNKIDIGDVVVILRRAVGLND